MHQLTQLAGDLHRQRPARADQPRACSRGAGPPATLGAKTARSRLLKVSACSRLAEPPPRGGCAQLETQTTRTQ